MAVQKASFVGRERELGALIDVVTRAVSGHGGSALVEGEAGIGKTTLMGHVAREADSALALQASARELERERPFGLVTSLLDDAPITRGRLTASRLSGGTESEPRDRYEILDEAVDAIEGVAVKRPVVLVAEDAQWASQAWRCSTAWRGWRRSSRSVSS